MTKISLPIFWGVGLLPCVASASPGFSLAASAMGFSNSTKQGGQGAQGSTVLTESQLMYQGGWWGLGAFYQFDIQGANEKDVAAGPKLELYWDPFYVEGGYAVLMERAFTDRSIAKQSGSGYFVGAGARFNLGAAGASGANGAAPGGFFMQFSHKHRVQTIKKQDSSKLTEAIVQTDDYPLFGLGYHF